MSLTRRQQQNLKVITHAQVQAALVTNPKYRNDPELAAALARRHAEAAVAANRNGKRVGK
jgi:hypothetical protein